MKPLFILIAIYLVPVFAGYAQKRVPRFDIYELEYANEKSYNDPYSDVNLKSLFKDSFGRNYYVNGFYDGNKTWKVRFSPNHPNTFRHIAQFSDRDTIFSGSFWGTQDSVAQPIEVNPINQIWLKRAVYPFLGNGAFVEWEKFNKYDTLYFNNLRRKGFKLLVFGYDDKMDIELFPLDFRKYVEFEQKLHWLWENDFVAIFPVTLFSRAKKPVTRSEWETYFSYFFARFGVYRNLMFYVPGNSAFPELTENDKSWIESSYYAFNKYLHPFAITEGVSQEVSKGHNRFYLDLSGNSGFSKNSGNYPVLKLLPKEFKNKKSNIVADILNALLNCNIPIIDLSSVDNNTEKQISELVGFFNNIAYFEMVPVDDITPVFPCIGNPGHEYLLLVDRSSTFELSLGNRYYKAMWVNPYKVSEKVDAGTVTGNTRLTMPNGSPGWLLYLNEDYSGYPQGIHVSFIGSPETTLCITWSTISKENPAVVRYREAGLSEWKTVKGSSRPTTGKSWVHWVELTGLKPLTTYEYAVSADSHLKGVFSETKQTSTLSLADTATYTFGWLTDTGLEGRLDNNSTGTRRIIEKFNVFRPDIILGGGDYAYANRDHRFKTKHDAIDRWFDLFEPVLSGIPFMTQYGNHELYLDEEFEDWEPYFNHPPGYKENRFYSFEVGNVHFTSFCLVDKVPKADELEWLENDLSKARADGKWLVVYHHEPLFAYGTSHPSKPEITGAVYPILRKYNVDLAIYSHDQNYERTFPLSGVDFREPVFTPGNRLVYPKGEGTIFMKISPSGKKSEIGNTFPLFQEKTPQFMASRDRSAHHFALFRVDEGKSIEVMIYNVPEDQSPIYLIDRFTITQN